MNSSQALAQSVLGNLAFHDLLHHLAELDADEGNALFGNAQLSTDTFAMEFKIDYLREPRPTSLDGYVSGEYRIAIECKFTEPEGGLLLRLTPAVRTTERILRRHICAAKSQKGTVFTD
jgi:hypothetical protein